MRRGGGDDQDRRAAGGETESKVGSGLARWLERHPRFGLWLMVVVLALVLAALVLARLQQG